MSKKIKISNPKIIFKEKYIADLPVDQVLNDSKKTIIDLVNNDQCIIHAIESGKFNNGQEYITIKIIV